MTAPSSGLDKLWMRPRHGAAPIRLLTPIVVAVGPVEVTGLHTTFLETGVPNRRDTDHSDQVSRSGPSRHRERSDRPASREPRSGNPRRRFEVRSKAGEIGETLLARHTASNVGESRI